jgi:hypothetical protein
MLTLPDKILKEFIEKMLENMHCLCVRIKRDVFMAEIFSGAFLSTWPT